MRKGLSDTLLLTDADDYIRASEVCTKKVLASSKKVEDDDLLKFEKDDMNGKYYQIHGNGSRSELGKVKEITLADCLTCSGCTTTAEAMLVNSQTPEKFEREIKGKILVVSVSQDSIISLMNFYGTKSTMETMGKVIHFFKKYYDAKFVFHCNHYIYMNKIAEEFCSRYVGKELNNNLPILTSHCPGFVCYAEKTHGDFILPYLSLTPSSQGIFSELIKKEFSLNMKDEKKEKEIYHVSVASCYDKKLEASREDFQNQTDLVFTTGEFIDLLDRKKLKFDELKSCSPSELDNSLFWEISMNITEFVIRYVGKHLFHQDIGSNEKIDFKKGRNSDFQIYTYEFVNKNKRFECDRKVIKFLRINGFRNIQMIIRRLKRSKCDYDFVEVNACPKGCLFGGGQLKPKSDEQISCFCSKMKEIQDSSVASENSKLEKLSKKRYVTEYHNRKGSVDTEGISW